MTLLRLSSRRFITSSTRYTRRTWSSRHHIRALATAGLSYQAGPTEPPLLHQTVGENIASIASLYGDSLAVVSRHQNARLSYHELHTLSTSLAHSLSSPSISIRKGSRVLVSLGNSIEYALLTFALFKLGAILVPLNTNFNSQQIAAAISHLDASHLIISEEANLPRKGPKANAPVVREVVERLALEGRTLEKVLVVENAGGKTLDGGNWGKGFVRWREVEEESRAGRYVGRELGVMLDPDEVVNIQFTSGTTSTPKAACLTHKGILNNGRSIGDRMKLTNKDIVCSPPPLFHCFGCVLGYLACTTHGSAIVWPSESFDPVATVQAVRDEKCTALHGVPTMFIQELELLDHGVVTKDAFAHCRTGIAAGSSVPMELMRKLHGKLNLTELTICYGMTETSPVSCMTTTADPLQKRIDTVGRPLPHVEVKVVNPHDHSIILPRGQPGELAVTGYNMMKHYWNDPVKTKEVMIPDEDGKVWMHTGDEAVVDEDGYVKITGRIKDLIIRGGENIHPLEIENCLLSHDEIAEVSVVGLKDPKYGEVVAAFVRKADLDGEKTAEITEDCVRQWIREKLSNHLVPAYVFWCEDFPKTASGKIQKFKLQEEGEKLRLQGLGAPVTGAGRK